MQRLYGAFVLLEQKAARRGRERAWLEKEGTPLQKVKLMQRQGREAASAATVTWRVPPQQRKRFNVV